MPRSSCFWLWGSPSPAGKQVSSTQQFLHQYKGHKDPSLLHREDSKEVAVWEGEALASCGLAAPPTVPHPSGQLEVGWCPGTGNPT